MPTLSTSYWFLFLLLYLSVDAHIFTTELQFTVTSCNISLCLISTWIKTWTLTSCIFKQGKQNIPPPQGSLPPNIAATMISDHFILNPFARLQNCHLKFMLLCFLKRLWAAELGRKIVHDCSLKYPHLEARFNESLLCKYDTFKITKEFLFLCAWYCLCFLMIWFPFFFYLFSMINAMVHF